MDANAVRNALKKHLVAVLAGAVFVAGGLWYLARSGTQERLDAEFDALSQKRSRMLTNVLYASGIEEDIARLEQLLGRAEARLFKPADLASNYDYFYQIEKDTGVKITNLRQLAPVGKDKEKSQGAYQSIRYQVAFSGKFDQLIAFMDKLERGRAFYRLREMSVSPVGSALDGELSASLSLEILGRKESV